MKSRIGLRPLLFSVFLGVGRLCRRVRSGIVLGIDGHEDLRSERRKIRAACRGLKALLKELAEKLTLSRKKEEGKRKTLRFLPFSFFLFPSGCVFQQPAN
jgi:hypothetical protein